MIYVVRNKKGKILCFSEEPDYVYEYLKRVYTNEYTKAELNIEKVEGSRAQMIMGNYDQCQLITSELGLILTVWEYKVWRDRFQEAYVSQLDDLENKAIAFLDKHHMEINDDNIDKYLRNKLGYSYFSLTSFEDYISSIDRDEIIDAIKYPTSRYIYHLYEEYHQIISDN